MNEPVKDDPYTVYLTHINELSRQRFKWQKHANCFDTPRGTMYPPRNDKQEQVVSAYCKTCPTKRECLYMALVCKEEFGVWGGTTEAQRATLQQKIEDMGHIKFKDNWNASVQTDIEQLTKDTLTIHEEHILQAQA